MVCDILYSEEYSATMAQLNAYLEKQETLEAALAHTATVLETLALHYTAWNYRYNLVLALNKDLLAELDWCELVALDNEKNYQIWHYRQLIIEALLDKKGDFQPRRELPIMNAMLEQDSKNHHVWLYRRWVAEKFQLYTEELKYTQKLIDYDLRNNSAWSHRHFVATRSGADLDSEAAFAQTRIRQCPENASSWNYLLAVWRGTRKMSELEPFCREFVAAEVRSTYAVETLAEIVADRDRAEAARLYAQLETIDPIRKNYWAFRRSTT